MIFLKSDSSPKNENELKLFFALSRTPHGIIDIAAPALAAILCLGHFPPAGLIIVGMITVFAGYTAVYALNDVVDFRIDKHKAGAGVFNGQPQCADLDSALLRHPMAKGALSLRAGLLWTLGWSAVAVTGAWWLNPVCLYIFLAGCILEGVYCLLLRVTPLRALINGVVKTLGALAAVFAVCPQPSFIFLALLFLWIFCWEIGGQNIPNDWTDMEEDRRFKAQTIPLKLGGRRAGVISLSALTAALFLNFALFWISPVKFNGAVLLTALAVNLWLLLWPGLQLVESHERHKAMALFNKASYYPLANLILVLIAMIV